MNVLSLFDGISTGRLALQRAGITVDSYYASEIDQKAIKISRANWSDVIQIGDIEKMPSFLTGSLISTFRSIISSSRTPLSSGCDTSHIFVQYSLSRRAADTFLLLIRTGSTPRYCVIISRHSCAMFTFSSRNFISGFKLQSKGT